MGAERGGGPWAAQRERTPADLVNTVHLFFFFIVINTARVQREPVKYGRVKSERTRPRPAGLGRRLQLE